MKLSRRTNAIILWVISLGLLVSMVIAFTPTLGTLFGNSPQDGSNTPAILINNGSVSELELARAQQNPPFNLSLEGEAGDDVNLLLVDSLVNNELIQQAAADTRVPGGEVNEAVNEFRQSQGVAGSRNDRAYLALIGRYGFDDRGFRDFYREQLRVEKYQEGLTESVSVSDEEVAAFYDLNETAYQTEERILARAIVLDDEDAADAALERAQAGEDFAALAEELSTERADRGGALGAAAGSSEPQPVGRAALPTAVANAAFGLQGPGLTGVVSAGSSYYLVQVEDYIAAGARPLDEVREQVSDDALEAKRAAVLESRLEELRDSADVRLPEDSTLTLEDDVVAVVGDEEIRRSELARAVYLNPQIQQSLTSESAGLITGLFKPTILEQLIDQTLAYEGAQTLDATFIGTKGQVAQSALTYVSRDASASDEELQSYYEDNIDRFTISAEAAVTRVNFADEAAASAFRSALLDGEALQDAADANGGEVLDLGTVRPGTLQPEIDTALFGTDAFEALPEGEEEISDVLVVSEPVETLEDSPEDSPEDSAEETGEPSEDAEAADENADAVDAEAVDSEDASEDETTNEAAGDASETATAEADADETTDSTDEVAAETTDAAEDAEATATDATAQDADVTEDEAAQEVATEDVYVVLVAARTPERVRDFSEVRAQVEDTVLQTKRSELQSAWLDGLREEITVENLLQAEETDPTFETTPLEGEDAPTGEGEGDAGDSGEAVDAQSGEAESTDPSAEDASEATDSGSDESTEDSAEDTTEQDEEETNDGQ